MQITQIKPTKRGRYSLFTSQGFLCSIDEETLLRYAVKENEHYTSEEFKAIVACSDLRKAKDKALNYLSIRAYASGELCAKLCKVFDKDTATAAVCEMHRLDLIDDVKFANDYTAYLIKKNKSTAEIIMALRQKGIDKQLAQDAIFQNDAQNSNACLNVIEKKYLSKLQAGGQQKVIAALMRRGFSYTEIKEALKQVSENLEFDEFYEE